MTTSGAVPVESLPLGTHRSALRTVATLYLSLVLGGLGVVLLLLWGALKAVGEADPTFGFEPWIGVLAIGVAITMAVDAISQHRSRRKGITLSDGRVVEGLPLVSYALSTLIPLALVSGGALVVGPIVLVRFDVGLWPLVGLLPLGVLFVLAMGVRLQSFAIVWSAHHDPPHRAAARLERWSKGLLSFSPHARLWLGVGLLWAGDADRAEKVVGNIVALHPDLGSIASWFRAGRGELDLSRALAEPDPEAIGDQYRWGVALALAALQAERPGLVAERLPAWRSVAAKVPNRFGGLLLHLCLRLDEALRNQPPGPRPDDLAWLPSTWPFAA